MKRVYAFERFNKIRGAKKPRKFKNAIIAFLLLSLPLAFALENKKNEAEKALLG